MNIYGPMNYDYLIKTQKAARTVALSLLNAATL